MKKYLESIKSFLPIAICFIVVLFCVKCFELFTSDSVSIMHTMEMIFSNLVASLALSFLVLIIFNLISLFSKKAAIYVSSILFAIIVISEIGLIFYHNSTGLMMGRELIERPFWETFVTIKSVLNFWMIAAAILFIVGFVFINIVVAQSSKLKAQNPTVIFLFLMIVSIPLFFALRPNYSEKPVNKIWYCFHSCFLEEDDDMDFRMASKKIEKYKRLFPEREFVDNEYPLERIDNVGNVLGRYFRNSESKPNIVFIVVESLGADLFGVNEYGYTFTPFLDSLSKHSLLWSNCISTTSRSFGVVPAITGSVPHGPRGFQFGNMPEHNSLYSVLKNNDYETSAFYAGDFSFDKVYDYLIAQNIDFMAPFYDDSKKKENKKYDFTYWGYQDKVMFDKSAEIISQRNKEKSYFDLLITISQHDNRLRLNDKNKVDYYFEKVSDIISPLPENERASKKEISGHLASMLYGDDAIRDFIKKYSELHQDGNYIFVITGDHSLNLNPDNPLDAYHVPLIIWSPLLTENARFDAVVSHNDIVPSLNALLHDNFSLKTPSYINWIGNGLDTSSVFRCDIETCFLLYTRAISDGIFDNYYYTVANGEKRAFLIKENLVVEEVYDKDIIDDINERFRIFAFVDNYAYSNNKVTKYPIFQHNAYDTIKEFFIDSIYCKSLPEKPSVVKPNELEVFSTVIDTGYKEVKIIMTADVIYTSGVWQDQFINLGVRYSYGKNQSINSSDNISKNFVDSWYDQNRWTKMEFVKIFSMQQSDKNEFEIYLRPTLKDYLWDPEHSILLKNINITILGN